MNYKVGDGPKAKVFCTLEEANRWANEVIRATKEVLRVTETNREMTHFYPRPMEVKYPEDTVTKYYTPRDNFGQRTGEVNERTMPREEYEWMIKRGAFFFDSYYEAQLAAMM